MLPKGALDGVLVLDLSRLLPGPYASMILADHGARAIAVEDPRNNWEGMKESIVHRNKEHMSLNLKSEKGREVFLRLAESADVVLEGFRPGVTQRLGMDYETLSGINPGIIYCSITGYGQTGPYKDVAGHDVNYLSTAGVLDLIGESDGPPVIPGVQVADMAGGGMNAVIGILMAMLERGRTGKGQYVDISMTDGSFSLLTMALTISQMSGEPLRRSDSVFSHRYACYNVYETKDGRYISIGAVENRFWRELCEFFQVPEYGELQYDEGRRQEIIDYFRSRFRKKTMSEWEQELRGRDVCWAPVLHMEEATEEPLFREREMVTRVQKRDNAPLKVVGTPVKLSSTPGSVRTPPPEFGGDTVRILEEWGYEQSHISEMKRTGAV